MNKDSLTYDQYAEIEKNGFDLPYIVEIERADQKLLFYGSEHTNNPDHLQFQDIESRWREFIMGVDQPIALVEGHFDQVSETDTEDPTKSIVQGTEAQFLVHLARRDNVPVASPEPDRILEADQLAAEFGRTNVIFYYFVRQLGFWNRFIPKPDIPAEAKDMLGHMKRTYKWPDVDFSVEHMQAVHMELFQKPFVWNDAKWFYNLVTPAGQEHITNKLARRSGELRDEYILQQIQDYWKHGKSPFLVFGSAHAIMLEPALRKLLAR